MNPPDEDKQIDIDHEHYRAQGLPNEPVFKKGGLTRVAIFFAVLFVMMGLSTILRPIVSAIILPIVTPPASALATAICGSPDC